MISKSLSKLMCVSFICFSSGGCGTYFNFLYYDREPFGGVKVDCEMVVKSSRHPLQNVIRPFCLLDIPLSAAADVATLPITLKESNKKNLSANRDCPDDAGDL